MATTGPYTVDDIIISIYKENQIQVKWEWNNKDKKYLDHYELQWYYSYKKKHQEKITWYSDSIKSVDTDQTCNDIHDIPDEAVSMKVRIRPVAQTHERNGTDTPWFTSNWKWSPVFKIGDTEVELIDPKKLKNLKISMQAGSDRTVKATWVWNHDQKLFDHYEVKWKYYTGDERKVGKDKKKIWFEGSTDTVTQAVATYDVDDSAEKVQVSVLPVAKTHWVKGREVAYWTTTWSDPVTFDMDAGPVPTAAPIDPKKGELTLTLLADTERDMYAKWTWDETKYPHVESYSVQWRQKDDTNGFWINEEASEVNAKHASFTGDDTSDRVSVRVRPNAGTHTKHGEEVKWWSAPWSEWLDYAFTASSVPSTGTVTDVTLSVEPGTDRTVFATWKWDQDHTDSYTLEWSYDPGDGIWRTDGETSTTQKQANYSAPSNAKTVQLVVTPVPQTYLDNGRTVPYWDAIPSAAVSLNLVAPSAEKVESQVTNIRINIQSGTERTLYATWDWDYDLEHTESYSVLWAYDTGDGVWFEEDESTVTTKYCIYNTPENAVMVQLRVRPNSTTYSMYGETINYWIADWSSSDAGLYTFKNTTEIPSAPSVTIKQYTLTAEVNVPDKNAYEIEFQVVKDNAEVFASGKAKVLMSYASFSCSVNVGGKYKARCKAYTSEGVESEWSEYSESVGTIPPTPSGITGCHALTQKSVELTWNPVQNAENYEIEYATNKLYFDTSSEVQSTTVEAISTKAIVTGLSPGEEWFFRLRATNGNGSSGWTAPVSVILGKAPDVPTTWSQTTIVMVGEDAILYWVHNSEDGSHQTSAEVELTIGGKTTTETVQFNPVEDDDESGDSEEETSSYVVKTESYSEGTTIKWRVRTKGIMDEFSPWSIMRTIDVYAPPTLILGISQEYKWYWDPFNFITDTIYTAYGECGAWTDVITSFPFYIMATPGPDTQKPIGYYLTITSDEPYETINQVGETVWVNRGDEVYAGHFDAVRDHLVVMFTPSIIDLENGISYTVHCSVYMDSGLSAEATAQFRVDWEEVTYIPNIEIGFDRDAIMTYLCPYCEDNDGNLVKNVLLSVYRREFDGTYTELGKDIMNTRTTYITDPHPSLDYARYRIVAVSTETGAIGYYDPPGYPINEKAVILQWNEEWSSFDGEEDVLAVPPWNGSMLKLPYNIDVSDENEKDVSLVKYIGRSYPVSYYGTQVGGSATWNVDIVKGDEETLYQLRRLMRYMGDVYVREPSGSGYWANIAVSFSQKHCDVTIPVTLNLTRVDGGA